MKILLAEDGVASLRLLERTVQDLGHDYVSARDGRQAWEIYLRTPDVQVVISDWMMPEIDGLELCRRVRALDREGYTFFMFLTVLDDRRRLLEGLRAGADEYLVKPLDREQLQARLTVASRVTSFHQSVGMAVKDRHDENREAVPGAAAGPSAQRVSDGGADVESAEAWALLISQGKLNEEKLHEALEHQRNDPRGEPREIGEVMVSLGIISRADLAMTQARKLGISYVELDARDVDPLVLDLVPERALRDRGHVPMRLESDTLFVATSDPTDTGALDDLGNMTGYDVVPVATSEECIRDTQHQLFGFPSEDT